MEAIDTPIDTLINVRWLIPVTPPDTVYENWSIAVHHGRVVELLPQNEAGRKYDPRDVVHRTHHAMLPGLVNSHTHAAMSLFKGLRPEEQPAISRELVADGARLAIAAMLKSGTTCFSDMYLFPEVTAQCAADCQIRAVIGINKVTELHDRYRDHPLVGTMFAALDAHAAPDETLQRLRTLSAELDLPIQLRLHETMAEIDACLATYDMRPLARLEALGLLSPALVATHMTHLDDHEIETIAETGVQVVHCPESDAKLGNGVCRVVDLIAAGVNVALGTESPAYNDDLDMIGEMRTATLLARATKRDANALTARQALEMATINGARALGLDAEIGTLEPGKWADCCCVDLERPDTLPVSDVLSNIVFSATREQVSDVWVAGRHLMSEGRLLRMDERQVLDQAVAWRHHD